MLAVRIQTQGVPEVLLPAVVPDPGPAPGEVLVRVRAVAVNWRDALADPYYARRTRGGGPIAPPTIGFSPGGYSACQ